jgi:hypothetical protein
MDAAGPRKGSSLFDSTSKIAGQQAARKSGTWRQRILALLRERPSTLWEVAQHFEVPDHTISGRFTELARTSGSSAPASAATTPSPTARPTSGASAARPRIPPRPPTSTSSATR